MLNFIATCLAPKQISACESLGVEVKNDYARSYGEITAGCVTDFSVHCFNSAALSVLRELGVSRATLHPELNLAQIRDIEKCISAEVIIYGKIPMMKLGNPIHTSHLTDRKGAKFFVADDTVYNSVPVFMADKLEEIEKTKITHGRFIFTTETPDEIRAVIKAYMYKKPLEISFTRGKFYSKV
jgi:collagenase-like PrtC family protease